MSFKVLLVDDDAADVFLAEDALTRESDAVVKRASDGVAALDQLAGNGFDLVLLDQNLPGIKGDEVVRALRANGQSASDLTPVVMFSTTKNPDEVRRAYKAGANAFVRKPDDLEGYEAVARSVDDFWNRTAVKPTDD